MLTTEGLYVMKLDELLHLDKTAEEIEEYYDSGMEAVRSGRYWEFGTTPYTGGGVDYFQPNWYRRVTSDWQYTDTLWGSKDEYWQNHFMPTPRNPLAPIKHFITDPYHWEQKHYETRPYPVTGGIPEISEFPFCGAALGATVGRLLKPAMRMHEEEWNNPGSYKEREGYRIAEELGISVLAVVAVFKGKSKVSSQAAEWVIKELGNTGLIRAAS